MKNHNISDDNSELTVLCNTVKDLAGQMKYHECKQLITNAMGEHPHAPEPHNLLGILLEKEGDHITAMKHFRAAWALDPTYIPARYNLDRFGSFFAMGQSAYCECFLQVLFHKSCKLFFHSIATGISTMLQVEFSIQLEL